MRSGQADRLADRLAGVSTDWKANAKGWGLSEAEAGAHLDRLIAYHRRRSAMYGERAARFGRIAMRLQLVVVLLLLGVLLIRLLS